MTARGGTRSVSNQVASIRSPGVGPRVSRRPCSITAPGISPGSTPAALTSSAVHERRPPLGPIVSSLQVTRSTVSRQSAADRSVVLLHVSSVSAQQLREFALIEVNLVQ